MTNNATKRYAELESEYNKLVVQKAELEGQISKVLIEKAQMELYPFIQGQLVKCVVPAGRTKKERMCQVEIDDNGQVWVRPVGDDGKLRGRRFKADPGENMDYTTIFKEADR